MFWEIISKYSERRVLNNKREAMSDADIENMMVFFGDILVLADSIFCIYHRPAGSLIDSELDDVE